MSKPMTWAVASGAIVLALAAVPCATAAVITLDFDSVPPNVGAGPAYLNSYGITLSGLSPAGPAGVVDIYNNSGPGSFWANDNFLSQSGVGAVPCSYTLNFSTPLTSISFERIATPFNLTTEPQWSATAYVGATPVGTVGESLGTWGNSPANPFTLTGAGITKLVISANGFGFTAIGSAPLDDFVLTEVPEPSTVTLAVLGLFGVSLGAMRRKHRPAC